MYGSIMRVRIKKGMKERYVEQLRELVPTAEEYGRGLHSVELAWEDEDPNRAVVVIHFTDKASYLANAKRPETDAQFRLQAKHFDGEPEWIDVNYANFIGKPLAELTSTTA